MPPKSKNSRGSSQKGSTNNADAIRKMYATTSIASTKVVEEKSQEPQLNEEKLNPKQSENITSNQPEKSSNPKSSQSKKKSSKSNKRVSNSTNSNEKQESTEKNVPEKLILPFSFTSTFDKELASPSPSSGLASNSEISRVKLSAESEQRILNLLSSEEFSLTNDTESSISNHTSMRQLNNIYKALEKMGFYVEHIQKALQQNFGKDLSGILDWLCLNVPHDQLPSGFAGSNYYRTDGSKIVITMPTVKPKKIDSSNKKEEETNLEIPQFSNVQLLSSKEKRDSNISNSNSPDQKENSKKWIQNYLSNLQEEEEEEKDLEEEQMLTEYAKLVIKLNALEDEKKTLQQNDRMKLKLIDTKINELKKSTAQVEKNKKFQRESPRVKAKIEEILALKKKKQEEQMRIKLEQRRLAKEEKERKEKEQKERNEKELSEGIFSLDSMFQEPVSNEQAPKTTKFIHYRNYTIPSSWSGQTPKQLLIDLCKKKFLLCNTPTFKNISSPGSGGACFAVTIYKSPTESEVIQMTETCETSHEAENYVATMALYKYWKDQPIYNLLPPLFRQLWLDWLQNETDLAKELQEKQNVERFQFLTKLIEENKKSKKNSNTASKHQKFPQRGEQGQTNKNEEEEKFEQIQIFQNPEEEKQFFLNILLERTNSNEYKQYEAVRKQLPIFEFKEQIRNYLKNQSKVIIISGETGCGKTTQVPQFILEYCIQNGILGHSHIVCTQPRRISAISVSQRVSNELGEENLSDVNQSLCGYQIRLESRKGHLTQLLYVTTGILIRKLKNDSLLKGIRYIILDEVHESTVELQFLLILLKRILLVRTDLTLVLMSATMESEKLVRYFQDYEAPLISVPGRTFPVEPFFLEDAIEFTRYSLEEDSFYALPYLKTQSTKQSTKVNVTGKSGTSSQLTLQWDKRDLEENPYEFSESSVPIPKFANCDPKKYSSLTQLTMSRIDSSKIQYDLIEYLLIYICSQDPFQNIEGSILIFLPGIAEIQKLYSQLQSHPKFSNSRKFIILPLHSILSTNNQRLVFEVPPKGVRKIVLATNIAETGITIPDAVFVIDTGRVKEMRYDDSKNMNCLEEIFISKANALQRRGRAGRVREGFCFHLFSQSRFLSGLVPYPQPELTRVSLDELCLHIKALDIGSPAEILGQALDPPSLSSIESALQKLRFVRALDALDNITPLGIHLSTLPVDVHIGKMLLLATIFSCLDPILVIAATISSSKSPFTISLDNQSLLKSIYSKFYNFSSDSELITFYQVFKEWKNSPDSDSFCKTHYLNVTILNSIERMMEEFVELLQQAKFIQKRVSMEIYNTNSNNFSIVKAIIVAGLYPNVCFIKRPPGSLSTDYHLLPFTINKTSNSATEDRVFFHPSSYLAGRSIPKKFQWLVFHSKVRSSRVFIRDSTLVLPYAFLLFGGPITVFHDKQQIQVGEWILLQAAAKTGVVFKQLRLILDQVLQKKITNPQLNLMEASKPLMETVIYLFQNEEKELELV